MKTYKEFITEMGVSQYLINDTKYNKKDLIKIINNKIIIPPSIINKLENNIIKLSSHIKLKTKNLNDIIEYEKTNFKSYNKLSDADKIKVDLIVKALNDKLNLDRKI